MKQLFPLVLALCGLLATAAAQTFSHQSAVPGKADSIVFTLKDLPTQITPVSFVTVEPSYRYFYIFGDGNFSIAHNIKADHTTAHRYPAPLTSGPSGYFARAYGIGIYSNGDRPPRPSRTGLVASTTNTGVYGSVAPKKQMVDTTAFLHLFPHAEAKMGEPLIYVLSFRNRLSTTITNSDLYLFFDGEIREVLTDKTGKATEVKTNKFGRFPVKETLIHTQRASNRGKYYGAALPAATQTQYKSALAFNISNLAPGEEERIFLEFTVDTLNFAAFNGKNKGKVDFSAVLYTQDQQLLEQQFISEPKRLFLSKLGFDALTGRLSEATPDRIYNYNPATDSTAIGTNGDNGEVSAFGNVLDVFTHSVGLVKGHDPNFLHAAACACPNTQGRKKLFITLHAENDGQAPVSHVYFDMELPDGLKASDIVGRPYAHHPMRADALVNSLDSISFTVLDDKHVRWHFRSLDVPSIQEYGTGDPRTYVEISFTAFTDVDPSALDSLLITCVRFDSPTSEPVCTYPVAVSQVSDGDLDAPLSELLGCGTCTDDPSPSPCIFWGLPCWVWGLLLVLLFLIVWWIRRRSN